MDTACDASSPGSQRQPLLRSSVDRSTAARDRGRTSLGSAIDGLYATGFEGLNGTVARWPACGAPRRRRCSYPNSWWEGRSNRAEDCGPRHVVAQRPTACGRQGRRLWRRLRAEGDQEEHRFADRARAGHSGRRIGPVRTAYLSDPPLRSTPRPPPDRGPCLPAVGPKPARPRSGWWTRWPAGHDVTPRQVVLAWLLVRSPAMLLLPGTGSDQTLDQNMAARAIATSAPLGERHKSPRYMRRGPPRRASSPGLRLQSQPTRIRTAHR